MINRRLYIAHAAIWSAFRAGGDNLEKRALEKGVRTRGNQWIEMVIR